MTDRGHQYTLISHIREQEGKEYPVELPISIWANDEEMALLLVHYMGYPFEMLGRVTQRAGANRYSETLN